MKAIEFEAALTDNGGILVPKEIAAAIPSGAKLRVTLRWDADEADADWNAAGLRRFEEAYAPEDSVYEQLVHRGPDH